MTRKREKIVEKRRQRISLTAATSPFDGSWSVLNLQSASFLCVENRISIRIGQIIENGNASQKALLKLFEQSVLYGIPRGVEPKRPAIVTPSSFGQQAER